MQLDRTPPTYLGQLPDGALGTRKTLQIMSELVRSYKRPGTLTWQAAHDLVAALPGKNWAAEVRVLHEYVRDHIRYTRDTHGTESVQTPDATLVDIKQGDCDDKATALAALLEAIGHPTRFVAIGKRPGTYSHVFVQTRLGTQWVSLDPTMQVPAGWAPPGGVSYMIANN
jgi:transglutaminase-like putative cysteine protease